MSVDMLLNFNYDKETFVWSESELFNMLSEYYGFNDIKLYLKDGEEIIIEKYNVVGSINGDDYFSIYNSNGDNDNPIKVDFKDVARLEVIF